MQSNVSGLRHSIGVIALGKMQSSAQRYASRCPPGSSLRSFRVISEQFPLFGELTFVGIHYLLFTGILCPHIYSRALLSF